MSTRYLDLVDHLAIAAEILDLDERTLQQVTKLDLADSALHAPAAGFGDQDFYSDPVDKAAVLLVRPTKNHPLPDGNKRAAWVALRYFLIVNGWEWTEQPSIDDAEAAMLAIAAGEWDEEHTAEWLRPLLARTGEGD